MLCTLNEKCRWGLLCCLKYFTWSKTIICVLYFFTAVVWSFFYFTSLDNSEFEFFELTKTDITSVSKRAKHCYAHVLLSNTAYLDDHLWSRTYYKGLLLKASKGHISLWMGLKRPFQWPPWNLACRTKAKIKSRKIANSPYIFLYQIAYLM